MRRVNNAGHFTWRGHLLLAGAPLCRQPIGLRHIDEDEYEIFYGPLLIGYVLVRDDKARIEPVH